MQKTALVTGANGFVGSHLSVKLVEEGFVVHAINRKNTSNNPQFMEFVKEGKIVLHQGDVTTFDYANIPPVDLIFHVAGKVSAYGKMADFEKINCGGTQRLLDFAKQHKPKCFTFFSSTAVYGYYGYVNLEETAPKKPFKNPYSLTKLKTENLVQDFCKQNEIDFLIVRPGNVFGEYDYTSSHEIYTRIKNEKMLICAGGKFKSCFVYVKNLVDATVFLAENPNCHNTDYNITDGQNETLKQMFCMIAKEFGVRPKFKNVCGPFAKFFACLVEGVFKMFCIKKAPLITKFSVWQNCADYSFSIKKLLDTGFKPQHTMQEGVKNTCKWIDDLGEQK